MWHVYVIHFDPAVSHARHYTGIARNTDTRLKHHKQGRGSKLCHVAHKRGVELTMQSIEAYPAYSEAKAREKYLKTVTKNAKKYCPLCRRGK